MADASFLFLRPLWLWGFVPLGLALLWQARRRAASASAWQRVVDAELVPYVLEPEMARAGAVTWPLFFGWALALLILAGPVRERQAVPVFEARRAQVILLDLSRSMLADDVAPDRLTRARYKLGDLLARAGGTRTALVAFAERPYVVSPLTDDSATLEAFLPSLTPEVMPAQGSRPDLAIAQGVELLERAGVEAGQLILIGDTAVDEATLAAARSARAGGHSLSVLGVGTARGAPLRGGDGRFVRRADGGIVVPQLQFAALGTLAREGGGVAVRLSSDASDLDTLERARGRVIVDESGAIDAAARRGQYWIERGPWLLPPLALFALGLFRRGVIA